MKQNVATTRRHFLKATGSATLAAVFPTIIPSSALGRGGTIAPSERIVMGGIGMGGRGTGDLKVLLGRPDVQFVAVCDADAKRMARAKGLVDGTLENKDCAAYPDMRELLSERPDIDAVLIATGDRWHAAASVMAMRAAKALTRLAYKPVVPVLSRLSLESEDELKSVVRECLASFPDGPADAAITKLLLSDDPEARRVGTELIGRRRTGLAVPALLKVAAKDEEESVRVAALASLRDLAGTDELETLLEILLESESQAVTQAVTHALVVVCTRHPAVGNEPAPACVDPLVGALQQASGPAKAALIQVLRRVGGPKASEAVRRAGGK